MKHTWKITILLLVMFFIAQIIGLYVSYAYQPKVISTLNLTTGEYVNTTVYNIPYGLTPPEEVDPTTSVTSIIVALFIAVALIFLLMRLRAETFLRLWFFVVITLGVSLALFAFLMDFQYAPIIALVIALPLAYLKVFKRNIIVHNATELLIYPGIAAIFAPLLTLWAAVILLVLISIYDMYAVWHAGFMQKMAKYQIETLKIFSGFFIPYVSKKDRLALKIAKSKGKKHNIKAHIAILGGGDVVFPIILASVILNTWGLIPALFVPFGATLALAGLFYLSEKGKFYPAMPFISAGCFVALFLAYLVH